MNFNSIEYLIFLPVVVILYWLLPHKGRWIVLLAASILFYMSWNAWLIVLIMVTTVTAYIAGIGIDRSTNKKTKKAWLICALIICLGLLIFFKYINFFLESVVGVFRLFRTEQDNIVLNVILPIGISFYTFQTLSYVIDVYRGDYKVEKHFGYFALYIMYFPQLIAGPIERPQDLLPQLKEKHQINRSDFSTGLKWLLSGFFRKCVIADFCGIFVNKVYADLNSANALAVFVASALFLVQIYNDFAGYSEIAMGSARLMGIKLSRNFDKPFTSTSFTEFFRRWHITLNRWFTLYVYIPLGGNRKGTKRKIINTLIVFSLCGLWHGANWTFVLWGLVLGVIISIESLLHKPAIRLCELAKIDIEKPFFRLFRQLVCLLLFSIVIVLFRAQSLTDIGIGYRQMFIAWGFGKEYFASAMSALGVNTMQLLQIIVIFVAGIFIYQLAGREYSGEQACEACDLPAALIKKRQMTTVAIYIFGILAIASFWLALISTGDTSAFQYFQF